MRLSWFTIFCSSFSLFSICSLALLMASFSLLGIFRTGLSEGGSTTPAKKLFRKKLMNMSVTKSTKIKCNHSKLCGHFFLNHGNNTLDTEWCVMTTFPPSPPPKKDILLITYQSLFNFLNDSDPDLLLMHTQS